MKGNNHEAHGICETDRMNGRNEVMASRTTTPFFDCCVTIAYVIRNPAKWLPNFELHMFGGRLSLKLICHQTSSCLRRPRLFLWYVYFPCSTQKHLQCRCMASEARERVANYLLTCLGGMFCASILATAEDEKS